MSRRQDSIRNVSVACVLALAAGSALGTDRTPLPEGANYAAVHDRMNAPLGDGVTIGIIDLQGVRDSEDFAGFTGGIINQDVPNPNWGLPGELPGVKGHTLGARFNGNFSYAGIAPRMAPINYTDLFLVGDPKRLGTDRHPTLAANIAAGGDFRIKVSPANPLQRDFVGIAKASNIYFAGIASGASTFTDLQSATNDLYSNKGARIMNFSVGMGASDSDDARQGGAGGADQAALYLDWFIESRDVVFVKSAGNRAGANRNDEQPGAVPGDSKITKPGDFYNGITVGSTDDQFRARAEFSSYWLGGDTGAAEDVRGKPDILAPGDKVWDGKNYGFTKGSSGTSFAAPHVTGVASMLAQNFPAGRQHDAIKAIILNSARKRKIEGPNNANAFAEDHALTKAQPSDKNYLFNGSFRDVAGGDPAADTEQWTPSKWSLAAGVFRAERPLDDEQGTGVLDADRAVDLLLAGEQRPGRVPVKGWSRDAFTRDVDAPHLPDYVFVDYELDGALTQDTFLTTTLAWDRYVTETDAAHVHVPDQDPPSPPTSQLGLVDKGDHYAFGHMTNLDLQVFRKDNTVPGGLRLYAESISDTDNVEHLHIPIATAGEYVIRVLWSGDDGVPPFAMTPYSLAWYAVPTPGATALISLGALFLGASRRRA